MITKNLMNALEAVNFTYVSCDNSSQSHAYSVYGGYLVTVYEEAGNKVAYFNFKFSENEENDLKKFQMSEAFSENIDDYSVTDYSLSEDGMRVYSKCSVSLFLQLIDYCVSLLCENGIRGVEYCSECGNKFGTRNPKKLNYKKENKLMCEHCALNKLEEIKKASDVKDVSKEGKALPGVIGSLLFSLLGVAAYFILYYYISPAVSAGGLTDIRYIFCACGTLVSFLAYCGYRVFSKKNSPSAYITVAVNSILFTTVGQYLGVVFEYIASNGYTFSALSNKHFWLIHLRNNIPDDLINDFTDYSGIFYKMLAISVMFAAVGAAIFLLTLHDKSIIKKETAEIETLYINSNTEK